MKVLRHGERLIKRRTERAETKSVEDGAEAERNEPRETEKLSQRRMKGEEELDRGRKFFSSGGKAPLSHRDKILERKDPKRLTLLSVSLPQSVSPSHFFHLSASPSVSLSLRFARSLSNSLFIPPSPRSCQSHFLSPSFCPALSFLLKNFHLLLFRPSLSLSLSLSLITFCFQSFVLVFNKVYFHHYNVLLQSL